MEHIYQQIKALENKLNGYVLTSEDDIKCFQKEFLGKKGRLHALFSQMSTLGLAERKSVGRQLNALKALATKVYNQAKAAGGEGTDKDEQDFTLPPEEPGIGTLHILTIVQAKICQVLEEIGFTLEEGPEIEDDWHNFTALNFPPHHPARDMQDTFFLQSEEEEETMALRTQTSSVQIRVMEKQPPPIRMFSIGRVFRKETISARSHCMFHQVEALYIDKHVSFVQLREALYYFVRALFGERIDVRFRPSYFPFTKPSAEVDIACLLCRGKGCAVCKHTGWLEIGGSGMVDPAVLENCNICPNTYTGFAFGIGVERTAMLLTQIPDVRLFTENDVRFLKQFTAWGM